MESLSIIVPVHNDVEGLKVTVESLVTHIKGGLPEIIVVNDGACPEATEYVSKCPFIVEIVVKDHVGSYGARNKGIARASGDYFAFIDAGVAVSGTWQTAVSREIAAGTDYCGGRIDVYAKDIEDIYQQYESEFAFNVERYVRVDHYAPTANLLVKREVIGMLGEFDKRLFSGGDFEFGRRVFDAGYAQKYSEDMRVLHDARGKKALIRKSARVLEGHQMLAKLYPRRFSRVTIVKVVYRSYKDVVYALFLGGRFEHVRKTDALKVRVFLASTKIRQILSSARGD